MAKIKQGLSGPFSGGLGGVVGSSWNGISYIRSYAATISNPRTDLQQDHRQKIAVAMKFLKPLKIFIRTGFKNYTEKMTAMNSAMSWNYHNALQGFYPDNAIDYSRALVAHGLLQSARNQSAVSSKPGTILFSWYPGEDGANALDKTLLVVYNPDKHEAVTFNKLAVRGDGLQTVIVPASFSGDLVHCYIAFITPDGEELSDSAYAGAVKLI